uniref:Beta-carotene isomerase D27-like C-terminal domain-containing protein n=1 Tax=Aureoumbra lagunensis TaxID=44058 RepID=A0A7S3JTK5_9STRA|mmetsp:Transcript_11111/g.15304  ORF Transcript_11111/g.15304 Transcript_11111/m.15304 type:complete len:318 (-) Transcript_11111:87-1040(-)|eukprot:CAMPEP_0197290478 /NCGR_PEP_ID=MMETSP0890-20130614/7686_1 /TAXON_ID=44058 ORGANISM="Aureoumbra lagunensis, Strain CCMP1510" /NCGR_SAMPLE_ID=MMETSP0890 /ASSEMBLY_ACC=CAM_ASM_000533 /LENGTH=317 /DNA_ID=CAMNT_0042762487 /DNA_START=45 /DNA_END=998 /DNA_ORIENTATION=+
MRILYSLSILMLKANALSIQAGASRKSSLRWPPEQADPNAVWDETTDTGPLGKAADDWMLNHFRNKMLIEVGLTNNDVSPGFKGVVELAHVLAQQSKGSPEKMSAASRRVLQALFPNWPPAPPGEVWLLANFRKLFAQPFPIFSTKLVAGATAAFCGWLIGRIELLDDDYDDKKQDAIRNRIGDGRNQLIQIKRCRFLEEAGCASICVNSCKMPTQDFFNHDMGVPCTIVPNYEDLSCQFKFGYQPTIADELEARSVSCFSICPVGGRYRPGHDLSSGSTNDISDLAKCEMNATTSPYCSELFYEEIFGTNLTTDIN